jgi:hypothetical protein
MTSLADRWEKDPGEFRVVEHAVPGEHEHESGAEPAAGDAPTAEPDTAEADYSAWLGKVDYDTLIRIETDVALGIPPRDSTLTYTEPMLAARATLEREHNEAPEGTVWMIQNDLPPLEASGERGVARTTMPKRNEGAVLDLLRPTKDEADPFADRNLPSARSVPASTSAAPTKVGGSSSALVPADEPEGEDEIISFGPGKTALGGDGKSKAVDWYVDVDFPPLEQKDAATWVEAMTKLSMLLPPNEESQRLVLGMVLNALGVNDVDQVIERIMAAVKAEESKQQAMGMGPGGFGAPGMMPPPYMPRIPPGGQFLTGQQGGGRESFSEAQVRRIANVVGEAIEVLEHVEEHGDPDDPDYERDFHPGGKGRRHPSARYAQMNDEQAAKEQERFQRAVEREQRTMSRASVEALVPGDRVRVGDVVFEVLQHPKRHASRPLMVVARPVGFPNATARNLQLGVHRMERVED